MKHQKHSRMAAKRFIKVAFLLVCGWSLSMNSFAQNNSIVLDGAFIVLDGGTAANNIYVVVDQSSTSGIVRPGGGHISSEGQYNFVKWVSGTSTGNYIFPFGVGGAATDYIPFTFNKTTAAGSNISMSTWTTNPQNVPHPGIGNVAAVTTMVGIPDSVNNAIDRFWEIQSSAAVTADLTFSYRGSENTTLVPAANFEAQHWNGSSWDAQAGPGSAGVTTGIGTVGPVPGQTTFSPWVLTKAGMMASITSVQDLICNGVCVGSAAVTPVGGTAPYTYSWTGGQTSSSVTGLCAGTYSVIVSDVSGLSATTTVTITQPALLTVTASATSATCGNADGSVSAGASGGTGAYTFSWNASAQTTQSVTGLPAGNYSVTVTDGNGCTTVQPVSITNSNGPVTTLSQTNNLCKGQCTGTAAAATTGGAQPYAYSWTNGQSSSAVSNLCAGDYTVTVTDNTGCTTAQLVTITEPPALSITATSNPGSVLLGSSATLSASGGSTYQWSPSAGLSCTTCANPVATPSITTTYCVLVSDINGCSDSTCITLNVEMPCGIIYLPNAFSPNNDGENDMECVLGDCIESMRLVIYNRWGEKVFESEDQAVCWDGRYKGEFENSAVYTYHLEVTLTSGKQEFKRGNISIIR